MHSFLLPDVTNYYKNIIFLQQTKFNNDFVRLTKEEDLTIMEERGRRMIGKMATELHITVRSASETAPEILKLLQNSSGIIEGNDGCCYLSLDGKIYSCPSGSDGTSLLERIAPAESAAKTSIEEAALRDILYGNADAARISSSGLNPRVKYSALLFRFSQNTDTGTLRALIPLEAGDRITLLEDNDAVLLIQAGGKTAEETEEFASAAAETLESEAGLSCSVGIGRPADTPDKLADSFREAVSALETGLRHRIPGFVYVYGRNMLERFADLIPEKDAEKLKSEMIQGGSEKVLTEETLETIRVFFRNDVNLSTTSRQLFIHRNTLIYRIEKIKRATGLDLRKFEDAAVFRILMSIPDKQA